MPKYVQHFFNAHLTPAIADTASKQAEPGLLPEHPSGKRSITSHMLPGWDEIKWDAVAMVIFLSLTERLLSVTQTRADVPQD